MKCFLTETQSIARALAVQPGIKYDVFLNLKKGVSYSGIGHYHFDLNSCKNVFLDFSGK